MIRIFYITSLWAIKKTHVRLDISTSWHVFHCIGYAWGTTCGTVRYVYHRVRILINWRILKIAVLNLERLNILGRLNISINRFISSKHFKLKQSIIDPFLGNSSLAFIKAGELFINKGGECEAIYSLGFNQGRICYDIVTFSFQLMSFSLILNKRSLFCIQFHLFLH